jgi:hypothetical protein
MDIVPVREAEVERLLQSGELEVLGKHEWRTSAMKSWLKVEILVASSAPRPPYVRLIVSVNSLDRSRCNFALLWNNKRIRALDINGSHENHHTDQERWVHQTHKHRWTDHCQDRFAYTPTGITATDVEGLLAEFCLECGIKYTASLAPIPPVQVELYDL